MSHQSLEALIRANEVRCEQARIKRTIASLPRSDGLRMVAAILGYPTEAEARMTIVDLLCSIRRMGPALADRLLISFGINWNRRVGPTDFRDNNPQLTARQRERLAKALRERA